MNIAKESITLNVTPEFADNLRRVAEVFGVKDEGQALEYWTGFIFRELVNPKGEIRIEVEQWDFDSIDQVDAVVDRAAKIDPWLATAPRVLGRWQDGKIRVQFGMDAVRESLED